jgi:hypothetical protein
MGLGLLDVVEDTAGVGIGDDATKVRGSLLADTGAEDDGLRIAVLEELEHVVQGEGTANVGVEDEETLRPALKNSITEVVEATSGA